ncbi:MAG: hypothetical protein V1799_09720 [bacterium]
MADKKMDSWKILARSKWIINTPVIHGKREIENYLSGIKTTKDLLTKLEKDILNVWADALGVPRNREFQKELKHGGIKKAEAWIIDKWRTIFIQMSILLESVPFSTKNASIIINIFSSYANILFETASKARSEGMSNFIEFIKQEDLIPSDNYRAAQRALDKLKGFYNEERENKIELERILESQKYKSRAKPEIPIKRLGRPPILTDKTQLQRAINELKLPNGEPNWSQIGKRFHIDPDTAKIHAEQHQLWVRKLRRK